MPVSGRYTWKESQSDLTIHIHIPIKGRKSSTKNLDIFVADTIFKVSNPPFLLDLNLAEWIQTNSCKTVLKDGGAVLVVNLMKSKPGLWHKLLYDGSKEEIKRRRRDSIVRREDEIQKQHEKARLKKLEEERMAVRKQMDLDQAEYQHIEDLKNKEKKEAQEKLYEAISEWNNVERDAKLKPNEKIHDSFSSILSATSDIEETKLDDNKESSNDNDNSISTPTGHHQQSDRSLDITGEENTNIHDDRKSNNSTLLPVRGACCIRFKHTPRIFKTPMRESTYMRETQFLIKNRPNLRNNKYFNTQDIDISEADPLWLKKKGDEFYLGHDYLSAINAYSDALEKNKDLLQALTNRSACFLHIGEPQRCIADGEEALRLIQNGRVPHSSLTDSKLNAIHKKLLIRIAAAHCQLGENVINFQNALECIQKAILVDKSDNALTFDLDRVKNMQEAFKLKVQADNLLANGKVASAIKLYKEAVAKESTLVSAKINYATAYLLQNAFEECISLCEEVLRELGSSNTEVSSSICTIPMPGTDRRRNIVLSTLYKKSEVYVKLKTIDKAISTLEMAKSITLSRDEREKIDGDIDRLKLKLKS